MPPSCAPPSRPASTRLLRLGGAHAIAALAYGTETMPRGGQDRRSGQCLRRRGQGAGVADCAIDFFAGPSEIVVVSSHGRPAWIAADLHRAGGARSGCARDAPDAHRRRLARAVGSASRAADAGDGPARTRDRSGTAAIVVARSVDEAIALCRADGAGTPGLRHQTPSPQRLTRAGTVFVGDYSAQALGDYVTGSNHVLPTSGAARARGGLSAADFVRVSDRAAGDAPRASAASAPAAVALAKPKGCRRTPPRWRSGSDRACRGAGTRRVDSVTTNTNA